MKTEPTIDIQSEVAKIHSQFGMTEIANYRIEKLFEMYVKQSSPKIKQLDQLGWLEQSNGLIYTPHVFGITYCIYEEKGMWWIHCQFYNNYENISTDFAATLDEAKAIAQADFEQRVKECLL